MRKFAVVVLVTALMTMFVSSAVAADKTSSYVAEIGPVGTANVTNTVTCADNTTGSWVAKSSSSDAVVVERIGGETANSCKFNLIAKSVGHAKITIQKGTSDTRFVYYVSVTKTHSVLANEKLWNGVYIGYEHCEVREVGDDLVLIFTNASANANIFDARFELPEPKIFKANLLAVAGGGAGGSQGLKNNGGGGGGAGGYTYNTNFTVNGGLYYVSVGKGGDRATTGSWRGISGNASVITNGIGSIVINALGGGGGGASITLETGGLAGGSGGGGAWVNNVANAGGAGIGGGNADGQGNRGGTPAAYLQGHDNDPNYMNYNNGGGGGGANQTLVKGSDGKLVPLGAGGAWGAGGQGVTNDITGTWVEYARGGDGGKKITIAQAKDGEGYGWGGNGGNGGPGGRGGDGIVVVRLTRQYERTKIAYPSVANGGLAKDPESENTYSDFKCDISDAVEGWKSDNYVSFNLATNVLDYTGAPIAGLTYGDVVREVTGVWYTNVNVTAGVTNGLAHHQYTIYLKEQYAWDDGSAYGSDGGYLIDWRITDDYAKIDATIKVGKTVEWDAQNDSNATVYVTSHATPGQNPEIPDVLFLGTLCGAHGLTSETINNSLNGIASKANVDYYFFHRSTSLGANSQFDYTDPPEHSGSLAYGKTIDKEWTVMNPNEDYAEVLVDNASGNHGGLYGFYQQLYAVMTNKATATKYDYIVLEFDGTRLLERYGQNFPHVAEVVEWLKPFYANDRVLWIVDDKHIDDTTAGLKYYPYFPNVACTYQSTSNVPDWETTYKGGNYWSIDDYAGYNALVGLLSPTNYPVSESIYNANDMGNNLNAARGSSTADIKAKIMATACPSNRLQVSYTHSNEVRAFLEDAIQSVAYNLKYSDKIMTDAGLSIERLEFFIATNDLQVTEEGWMPMMTWTPGTNADERGVFDYSGYTNNWFEGMGEINIDITDVSSVSNSVTIMMTNMLYEMWSKIEIHVQDDGKFKSSVSATYNESTGQWEKNPNDGKAHVVMVHGNGSETLVKGEAATATPWTYTAYDVHCEVKNGFPTISGLYGAKRYSETNGNDITWYDTISFSEGYMPVVAYPGRPGYAIESLSVNGVVKDINDSNRVYYQLGGLDRNYDFVISYDRYVQGTKSSSTNVVYDGLGHVFPVKVSFTNDVNFDYEVRYALPERADDPDAYTNAAAFCELLDQKYRDIGTHEFAYKVWAMQPGYGETYKDDGWVELLTNDFIFAAVDGGTNSVTITQRPVTITPNPVQLSTTSDKVVFDGFTISGLVDDEVGRTPSVVVTNGLYCKSATYKAKTAGQYEITLHENGTAVAGSNGNYFVSFASGTLSVGEGPFRFDNVPQSPWTPSPDDPFNELGESGVRNVVKTYDGVATNIRINVTDPVDPSLYAISYRLGDDGEWRHQSDNLPPFSFTEVSTNGVNGYAVNEHGAYKVWYRIEPIGDAPYYAASNFAYVTILPRKVSLESASAMKRFDGYDLITNAVNVAVEGVTNLTVIGSEALEEMELPLGIKGDGLRVNVTGKRWTVGVETNSFGFAPLPKTALHEATDTNNYVITSSFGTLVIRSAGMIIGDPDDPENPPVEYPADVDETFWPATNGVKDVVKCYDGTGTNVHVNVLFPKNGQGCKIEYQCALPDGGLEPDDWREDLVFTNVCEGVGVYFRVTDRNGNFTPALGISYVTITQRVATVTAANATKVYDGTALATNGFTTAGFVEGEGLDAVTMTGDSITAHVGAVSNRVASVTPSSGTDLGNYRLEYIDGELAVTKRRVVLASPDQDGQYGEESKFDQGYTNHLEVVAGDITADNMVGGEVFGFTDLAEINNKGAVPAAFTPVDGSAMTSDYDITKRFGTLVLSEGDIYLNDKMQPPGIEPTKDPETDKTGVNPVIHVYDGNPTSITVNVTYPSKATKHIQYSLDKVNWSDAKPMFTNVLDFTKVYYSIVVDNDGFYNYVSLTNYAWVTILPRPIAVVADDQYVSFDKIGNLPTPTFTVSNAVDAAIGDEVETVFDYKRSVSSYEVKRYENEITNDAAAVMVTNAVRGDVTMNYTITSVPGDLEVTYGDFTATPDAPEKIYDGEPTNITIMVEIPDGSDPDLVEVSTNGTDWIKGAENLKLTDAGTYTVFYRVTKEGYNPQKGATTVTIAYAPIYLKANDKSKTYGGPNPVYDWTACYTNGLGTFDAALELPAETVAALNGLGLVRMGCDSDMKAPGDYPDSITATPIGVIYLGNYEVVACIPGTLTINRNPIKYFILKDPFSDDSYEQRPQDQPKRYHRNSDTDDNVGSCVRNVLKHYDGDPTNVVIVIDEPDPSLVTIYYSTNDCASWTKDAELCTAAGEYKVWYRLVYREGEEIPQNENDYATISNYAYVTVLKVPLTVRADDREIPYGSTPPGLDTYTWTGSGYVGGEDASVIDATDVAFASVYTATMSVGTHTDGITVGGLKSGNYDISYEPGDLIVIRHAIDVPVGSENLVYNGDGQVGLADGEGYRVVAGGVGTNAAPYAATVELADNYCWMDGSTDPKTVSWTIAKRPLTLQAKSKDKPYDGEPLEVEDDDITPSGQGYAKNEKFAYIDKASIIDVGMIEASFSWTEVGATAKLSNYEVSYGEKAYLEITPALDEISVVAASEKFAYNGMVHSNVTWSVRHPELLTAGDDIQATIDSKCVVKTPADGIVTNSFATNLIRRLATGEDVTRNYNFTNYVGLLEVTNGVIDTVTLVPHDGPYDGTPYGITVITNKLTNGRWPELEYGLTPKGPWQKIPFVFTDATNVTVYVVAKPPVDEPWYDWCTNSATVTITPRAITLASADEMKSIDEVASLSTDHDRITVASGSFVAGESFAYVSDATQTGVGSRPAGFTWSAANAATKLSNYAVTPEFGTLTITKSGAIGVTAASATWVFDNSLKSNHCYTATGTNSFHAKGLSLKVTFSDESQILWPGAVSNVIVRAEAVNASGEVSPDYTEFDIRGGLLTVVPAKLPDGIVGVSTNGVYDGTGYVVGVDVPEDGILTGPIAIRYSLYPNGPFGPVNPALTNAGSRITYFTVTAPGYETVTNSALVTVTPRKVTLLSGSDRKVYDGTPLEMKTVGYGPDSLEFVGTDGYTVSDFASQTDAGSSDNLFNYALKAGTIAENYSIEKKYGKLTVDPADFKDFTISGREKIYDGLGGAITLTVDLAKYPSVKLSYATIAGVESAYTAANPSYTNVATYVTYAKIKVDNYKPVYTNESVSISPRPVTLTSASETWKYDGKPHSTNAVDRGGFVAGEDVTANATGEITDVGTAANPFTYSFDGVKTLAANYSVSCVTGVLEVTKAPPPEADEDGELGVSRYDFRGVYDGEPHTINTNALFVAYTNAVDGQSIDVAYATTTNGTPTWHEQPFTLTDVGTTQFWYRVETHNYETVYHRCNVTVTNRPVTITFAAADKIYDETTTTICTSTNFANVVAGEGFELDTRSMTFTFVTPDVGQSKTVTAANYSVNLVAPVGAAKTSNYSFSFVDTAKAAIRAAALDFRLEGYNGQYDGNSHSVEIVLNERQRAGTTFSYSVGGEGGPWIAQKPLYTNVTNVVVWVKLENSNYDTAVASKSVTIVRRRITLEGPDKSKDYDGEPLTFGADRISDSGSKYAPDECFRYSGFASITEVGSVVSTFVCNDSDDGRTKLSNYEITIAQDHFLTVNPSKDAIGVKSLDYRGKYDGQPHGAGYELINPAKLISGDEFDVELEGVTVTTPDDGVKSNTFAVVRIMRGEQDVTSFYANFLVITGTLEVINADFGEDDIKVIGVNREYDGTATNVVVDVDNPLATEVKVRYSSDESLFAEDVPTYVNVTSATTWCEVTAKYFNAATNSGLVKITRRYLELASAANDGRTYNGSPFSTDVAKISETSNSRGFVPGEEVGCSFVSTTNVIEVTGANPVPASFDVVFDESLALSGNYDVGKVYGLLHIYPQGELIVRADDRELTYHNGEPQTWHQAVIEGLLDGDVVTVTNFSAASFITRPKEGPVANEVTGIMIRRGDEDVTAEYSPTFIAGELTMKKLSLEGLVSTEDIIKVYDAKGASIAVKVDRDRLIDPAAAVTIEYRTSDSEPWSTMNPVFTNRVDETVQYRVTVEEYLPYAGSAAVEISLRPVKVVSASASRPYNGEMLSSNYVWVAIGDGFRSLADGGTADTVEYLAFSCTGSQTECGTTPNAFTCWVTNRLGTADLKQNYYFTQEFGSLAVTKAELSFAPESYRGAYDGDEHSVRIPDSQPLPAGSTKQYSLDGMNWVDEPLKFRDVTNVTVYAKVEAPNYATKTVPVPLEIWRRQLSLEAPDKKQSYNGEILTFADSEIKAGGQLYATGECFAYSNRAGIKDVGRVASTFDYTDNPTTGAKLSNYQVTIIPDRWLEVTPADDRITVRSLSYYGKFDGDEHGAGYETTVNGRLADGDVLDVKLDGRKVRYPSDGTVSNTFEYVRIMRAGVEVTDNYPELTIITGTLEVVNADFGDGDIVAKDVNRKYDGTATNIVVEVKNPLADGWKVRYSTDGESFSEANPSYSNVVSATVWYEVSATNFNPYTNSASVAISKRKVGFRSLDDRKRYDGTALETTNIVEITEAGYDGFAQGEGVTCSSAASIAAVGSCEAKFNVAFNAGTLKGNYSLVTETGTLRVLSADDLTIIAGSEDFTYDGELHSLATGYTVENLRSGDRIASIAFDGAISHPDQSPVKNRVIRGSVKIVNAVGEDVTASYGDFTTVDGKLTMSRLSLEEYVSARDAEKIYDAASTNVIVDVELAGLVPAARSTVQVRYSTRSDGTFSADNPKFVKAGDYDVWYIVSASGYLDTAPAKARVHIGLRSVKLVSSGAERLYNGRTLSINEVRVAEESGYYGLADGEYLEYRCTASLKNAGEIKNTFTFAMTNAAMETSLKDNYYVSFEHGLIKVGKVTLSVKADDRELSWGDPLPEYTYQISGFVNNELAKDVVVGAPALACSYEPYVTAVGDYPAAISCTIGTLSAANYAFSCRAGDLSVAPGTIRHEVEVPNVPYDGKGTNISVTVMAPPTSGISFRVRYRVPGMPEDEWLDNPPVYTNAGPYDVTYMIEDGDEYTPVTNTVTMTITPRRITLESSDKDKVYDGTALELNADEIAGGGMGFAEGERFDFTGLASRTEVGTSKASFGYGDGTAKRRNYEVLSVDFGELTVKPNPEQILVRSASGRWTYDGKDHSTNVYEIVGEDNLVDGDEIEVVLAGTKVKYPSLVDETNRFTSVRIIRPSKGNADVSDEYRDKNGNNLLITEEGLLTVVNAKFADPTVTPYRGIYDGKTHGIEVKSQEEADGVAVTVSYPETGNDFTDVTNSVVKFRMTAEYYDDYEGESMAEILPRKLTFKSADRLRMYDGSALQTETDKIVCVGDAVEGESATFENPGSRIEVGRSDATFDVKFVKAGNYEVEKIPGTLTVYDDDAITVIATNGVHVFDGETYTNHDFAVMDPKRLLPTGARVVPIFDENSRITLPGTVDNRILAVSIYTNGVDITSEFEDPVLVPGVLRVEKAKFENVISASTNVVYDGNGYSIMVEKPSFKGAGPLKIEYSTTGETDTYASSNPAFAAVGKTPYRVYYRICAPGYEDYDGVETVTIRQRPVTLVSDSKDKVYDGICLSNDVVKVDAATPLADGDALIATTTAAVTDEGSVDNTFDYMIVDETTGRKERTKNYAVSFKRGKLTVDPFELEVNYSVSNRVYNGTTNAAWSGGYSFTPAAPNGESFELNADGVKFWFANPNVGDRITVTADKFTLANVESANAKSKKSNYRFSFVQTTTADILPAEPPPLDPKQPGTEFPPAAGPFYRPPAEKPPAPVDGAGKIRALSNYDIVTVYDGRAHTFDRAALTNSIATNEWIPGEYGITYSLDGTSWTSGDAPFSFTNVVATSFWYRVTAPFDHPNYSNYIHAVGVTITNRHVTFVTGAKEFVYNGCPQAYTNVTVETASAEEIDGGKQTGFVPGEGLATTTGWSTVMVVERPAENDFAYTLKLNREYGSVTNNYLIEWHKGSLTISPRKLTVFAGDQEMVYSDPESLTPGFTNKLAWSTAPAASDSGLVAGDTLEFVDLVFNLDILDYKPGETNKNAIVTNARPTAAVYAISNLASRVDVTRNYAISFVPGDLWVDENVALFKATLKWQYSGASMFYASLTIENTNSTDRFKYDPGSLRFSFESRVVEGNKLLLTEVLKGGAQRPQEPIEGIGGVNYSSFYLADPDPSDERGGWRKRVPVHYGPREGEVLDFVPAFAKYNGNTPLLYISGRDADFTNKFANCIFYLMWKSDGVLQTMPLVVGDELPRVLKSVASVRPSSIPLTASKLNEALAYGLRCDATEPSCEISDFSVCGDRVTGSIRTSNGVSSGVPSANATVIVEGTDELGDSAAWTSRSVEVKNGEFEAPNTHRFYRVRVSAGTPVFK